MHDTYGFPLELTQELARERGLPVDEDRFKELMEEQRKRSRRTSAADVDVRLTGEAKSEFVGYEKTEVLTQIGALEDLGGGRFLAKLREEEVGARRSHLRNVPNTAHHDAWAQTLTMLRDAFETEPGSEAKK